MTESLAIIGRGGVKIQVSTVFIFTGLVLYVFNRKLLTQCRTMSVYFYAASPLTPFSALHHMLSLDSLV